MKTLEQLYAEVTADENLRKEFFEANESGKIGEFLKAHDCKATLSEFDEFMKNADAKSGELSDDELDNVAAGKKCGTIYHDEKPVVTALNSCKRWRCCLCECNRNEKHKDTHTPGIITGHFCKDCKYYELFGMLYLCTHPARHNN